MATALTHIGFVNKLKKSNKKLFDSLDLKYVYSGALFPDYYGFYKIQLKKQYAIESIIKDAQGITFGKQMLKLSRTTEEKSFAIGFITHSVLDSFFHKYFKQNNIYLEEHLMLEFFYDCKYKKLKTPVVLYPKNIIEKTLKKYYKTKINSKEADITFLKLKIFYLFLKEIQAQIINKKYIQSKKSYIDLLSLFFYRGEFNIKKLLSPDLQLKKKHLKNLEREFNKAFIENNKILKKIKYQ